MHGIVWHVQWYLDGSVEFIGDSIEQQTFKIAMLN